MSSSTIIQVKALCFILLLAGNEAARIHNHYVAQKTVENFAGSAEGPEDTWKELNTEKCNWDWSYLACRKSDSSAVCKYRPLPLDVTYSQSCRLSDEGMLKDTEQYYGLQAELLEAKAKKFAKDCQSVNLFNVVGSMRCKRRVKHMMRAMTFMNKAEVLNKTSALPEEEVKSAKKAMKESLSVLAGAIGEDGETVMELIQKVQKSAALREDPSGTMGKSSKILWALLMGSDAKKEEARKEMEALVEANSSTVYKVPSEADLKSAPGGQEIADSLDDLEVSLEEAGDDEKEGAASSLLQQFHSGKQLTSNGNGMPKVMKFLLQFMIFMVIAFVMYQFLIEYVLEQVIAHLTETGIAHAVAGNFEAAAAAGQHLLDITKNYETIKTAAAMVGAFFGLGGALAAESALD